MNRKHIERRVPFCGHRIGWITRPHDVRRVGNDNAEQCQDNGEIEQPDTESIDARKRHIGGANHQGQEIVGRETGQARNQESQDHGCSVEVEPFVVIGACFNELGTDIGLFQTHHQGHHAGNREGCH